MTPAAEADGPPRIWGVEMRLCEDTNPPHYEATIGSLTVSVMPAIVKSGHWWHIDNRHCIVWADYARDAHSAALAIETELTRIESGIRTAREGKK